MDMALIQLRAMSTSPPKNFSLPVGYDKHNKNHGRKQTFY